MIAKACRVSGVGFLFDARSTNMPGPGWINSIADAEGRKRDGDVKSPLQIRRAERFLSAQADPFAGAKGEEKASACCVRNDGVSGGEKRS